MLVFHTKEFVMFALALTTSVLPGITYASRKQSNIIVPAEVCEQLSSSAKANTAFILMRCHFSFTAAFLQCCFPQSGILRGQRKKDDFSRDYVSFQTGFWMLRCYLNRNVIHSRVHVRQYRSHYSGGAYKLLEKTAEIFPPSQCCCCAGWRGGMARKCWKTITNPTGTVWVLDISIYLCVCLFVWLLTDWLIEIYLHSSGKSFLHS